MIIIKVDKGIEKALKKYKNKWRKLKIGEELRNRKKYEKKSAKNRKKKLKAIYIEEKYGDSKQ